jgi:hypothetical protein
MWPRAITAILISLFGAGCGVDTMADADADATAAAPPPDPDLVVEDSPGFCARLPATGPCALACELDRLRATFVPEGACVVFACTLTDGEAFTLHVCNPADG